MKAQMATQIGEVGAVPVVRLPRSAFLDQAHIRAICTRVQIAAKACPRGAIYARARAFTPLHARTASS